MATQQRRFRVTIVETTVYTAEVRASRGDLAMTRVKHAVRRGELEGIHKTGPAMNDMHAEALDD